MDGRGAKTTKLLGVPDLNCVSRNIVHTMLRTRPI